MNNAQFRAFKINCPICGENVLTCELNLSKKIEPKIETKTCSNNHSVSYEIGTGYIKHYGTIDMGLECGL